MIIINIVLYITLNLICWFKFFLDQLAANSISALHDDLLLSGCLLSLLSCPDKDKHGRWKNIIELWYVWILLVLFLFVEIAVNLI